jgi:lysophospholipase L1-like esterase
MWRIFLGVILTEVFLWTFARVEHPYRGTALEVSWPKYHPHVMDPGTVVFRPDPQIMPGTKSPSRFTINEFGFRSSRLKTIDKGSNEVRIFCLGGSTTECLFLDDDDAWPERLGRLMAEDTRGSPSIDVVNAGSSGHGTRDYIGTLAQRIVPLHPDIVIIQAGTNDLTLASETSDYDILRRDSSSRFTKRLPPPGNAGYLARVVACDISQIARRFVLAKRGATRVDEQGNVMQDLEGRFLDEQRKKFALMPPGHAPTSVSTEEYEQNLQTLIGIVRAQGATPVLVNQPTKLKEQMSERDLFLCNSAVCLGHRCPPGEVRALMDSFNAAMQRVARQTGTIYVDLASAMSGNGDYFYDTNHYNIAGASRLAEIVHQALLKEGTIRKRLRVN